MLSSHPSSLTACPQHARVVVVEERSKPIPNIDDAPRRNRSDRRPRPAHRRAPWPCAGRRAGKRLSHRRRASSTPIPTAAPAFPQGAADCRDLRACGGRGGGRADRAAPSSHPRTSKQQQTSVTRVFDPKSDGVSCPKDASWSPDGGQLLLYYPLLNGAQIWGSRDLRQRARHERARHERARHERARRAGAPRFSLCLNTGCSLLHGRRRVFYRPQPVQAEAVRPARS